MPELRKATPALVLVSLLTTASPALAQDASDRALLATFCDAANIKGSACKRAKGYPDQQKRACDVKLTPARHSGKFAGGGRTLLVVTYESECEPHATNFGGAVLFEQNDEWLSQHRYMQVEAFAQIDAAESDLLLSIATEAA